jgi:hypothetical protein
MLNQTLVVPKGAAPQAGYYPGVAPASQAGRGAQLATAGMRLVGGPESKPVLEIDERHCRWIDGQAQCRSWPVKNRPNPDKYCAGHLRKVAATNGPQPTADQGLRSAAS